MIYLPNQPYSELLELCAPIINAMNVSRTHGAPSSIQISKPTDFDLSWASLPTHPSDSWLVRDMVIFNSSTSPGSPGAAAISSPQWKPRPGGPGEVRQNHGNLNPTW